MHHHERRLVTGLICEGKVFCFDGMWKIVDGANVLLVDMRLTLASDLDLPLPEWRLGWVILGPS